MLMPHLFRRLQCALGSNVRRDPLLKYPPLRLQIGKGTGQQANLAFAAVYLAHPVCALSPVQERQFEAASWTFLQMP